MAKQKGDHHADVMVANSSQLSWPETPKFVAWPIAALLEAVAVA